MKADNQKVIEQLLRAARIARASAADQRAAAEAELAETRASAESLTAELLQQHKARLEKELRKKAAGDLALDLLYRGNSVSETADLLRLPESVVSTIAENVGLVRHEEKTAGLSLMWLEVESMGRGGNILLHWGTTTCTFWWEFGTGDVLTFIEIPGAGKWEAATGIPLERRDTALHFIGKKVAGTHGSGPEKYRIDPHEIVILK